MDTPFASPAERPRLEALAAPVPASAWIAVVADAGGAVAAVAARASTARVLAVVEGSPLPALMHLSAEGVRHRVHLVAGGTAAASAAWREPLALLCLPARDPCLRTLFQAWGRHVRAPGHVLFVGGLAPHPRALGVSDRNWIAHLRGDGLFLLTRRPHG